MGIVNNIKNYFKRQKDNVTISKIIDLMNLGLPLSTINKSLYDIAEIRTAINFIATKVSQVPFHHIKYTKSTKGEYEVKEVQTKSSFEKVLNIRTNQYNNPCTFLTVLITQLMLRNEVYCMPFWKQNGDLESIYIMPVVSARFVKNPENELDSGLYIELSMSTGVYTFPYDEVIHLQRFSNGLNGSTTHATTQYTDIISAQQQQAVDDSQKSGRIKGLISAKAALKSVDVMKRLNEFKDVFMTSENTTGMGFMPGEYEFIPVDLSGTAIDSDLLDKTINHVYNYFGVNDKIINNSATELEYEQFIDNTIKPLVLQIEQEFTFKLFSLNEIYNFNRIEAELIDLEISSLSSKTAFYKEMVYGTIMSRNEIRKRLKLSPGPEALDEFLENKNFQVVVNQSGGVTNDQQA